MLQDYRQYITNLRNNLIQCGVGYPIAPLETYRDLFYEANRLEQVLWYYSVLSISNSESAISGYPIPLEGYFKERLREGFYSEFQNFLEDYKKISALALTSDAELFSGSVQEEDNEEIDLVLEGEEQPQEEDDLTIEDEDLILPPVVDFQDREDDDIVDIFLEEPTDSHGVFLKDTETHTVDIKDAEVLDNSVPHGVFLEDVEAHKTGICGAEVLDNSVPHGVFLEDTVVSSSDDKAYLEGSVPHGVFIDDISTFSTNTACKNTEDSVYLNIEGVPHGVFIEEIETKSKSSSDDYYEDDDLPTEYSVPLDDEEEEYYDDDDDLPVEHSVPLDDEEEYYDDEEDLPVEHSVPLDEDEEEYYNRGCTPPAIQEEVKRSKDLSDYLQDTTNSVLTAGKRFIVKEIKKLKNG